ncbi:MAG: dihydrolipoamide acyltransferase [Hydrocarboniphaga sp.]|uniref:lipoyl domain-containing protein n=1 Tax=Hydrocarboniphaga sp. TaxID=2033016 RepID=UPI002623DAEB|nr:lipoyl domain-containing protein [Hydrocarboniphaga sp.]MDB5971961.1 dihydrolipoamide acyltransferase [Hydrocarboniphaga sp.]
MSTQIILPRLGFSMNDGTLAEWHVEDGHAVSQGQVLYSLESDKSVQEIEAPASGTLKIIKPAGAVYVVGTILGEIV